MDFCGNNLCLIWRKLADEVKILYWKLIINRDVALAKGFDFAGNIVDSITMGLFRCFVTPLTNVKLNMKK